MTERLDERALNLLFRDARTHNAWNGEQVPDTLLHELVDLMKMGPTTANSLPGRIAFVKSPEAKERLKPHLSAGNLTKTMAAPVCAILAYDVAFYDRLAEYFPHEPDARNWFAGDPAGAEAHAFRNGSLQGGYFILAARALGLDTGPMSGFDTAGVDAEFFAGTTVKSNFLCNLGIGDPSGLFPRSPRPGFGDIAEIL